MANALGVGFRMKASFFDSKPVVSMMDRKTRKVFSKFGAFVRVKARSLVNKKGGKKNVSAMPGDPPRRHVGTLRRGIFFSYEMSKKSVVIGPVVLGGGSAQNLMALDQSGSVIIQGQKKQRRVFIKARPFMMPAYEEEQPKLSAMWKDA